MRQKLKYLALRTCAAFLSRRIGHAASNGKARIAVVIPPSSPGGLGDDALVSALTGELAASGFQQIIIATPGNDDWRIQGVPVTYTRMPSLGIREWMRFLGEIRGADALFLLGADMLDGYYHERRSLALIYTADMAARLGLKSTIVGSSFNGQSPASIKYAFEHLSPKVKVCIRDELSKSQMDALRHQPSHLVADIAFLLPPSTAQQSPLVAQITNWIGQERKSGSKLVLGCNVNFLPVFKAGKPLGPLVAAYRDAIVRLSKIYDPMSVVLAPHDWREPSDDVTSLLELEKLLPPEIRRNRVLLETRPRAAEAKGAMALCDIVLAGRMHLAVGCLGAGTPVACIGYQGKYSGLFNHFGLDGYVLGWNEALEPGQLSAWIEPIIADRARAASQINQRLPEVKRLARLNVTDV